MAKPELDNTAIPISSIGSESSPRSIIINGTMWTVYYKFGTISIKEYEGPYYERVRIGVSTFSLSAALNNDLSINPNCFWLWEVTSGGVLNLVEIEPHLNAGPIIIDSTQIKVNIIRAKAEVSASNPVKLFCLNGTSPNTLTLSEYPHIKTAVESSIISLYWNSTRPSDFDAVSSVLTEVSAVDVASPPNISIDSYGSTPVADFSASPLTAYVNNLITFTNLSTGSPTAWAWDFGDGNTSTEQNPSHTYSTAGDYSITLVVTNEAGTDTKVIPNYINIIAEKYVDFDAVSDGDGSIGSPHNRSGFITNYNTFVGVWHAKGYWDDSGYTLEIATRSLNVDSWDTGNPFRWNLFSVMVENRLDLTLSNSIIYCVQYFGRNGTNDFGSPTITINNSFIKAISFIHSGTVLLYLNISNSTFVAPGDLATPYWGYPWPPARATINNSIIVGSNYNDNNWDAGSSGKNNAFASLESKWFPMTDSQFGWTPPTWPVWNSDKELFSYHLLKSDLSAPPSFGDPGTLVPKDMWGNDRRDIGGFYFATTEPPISNFIGNPQTSEVGQTITFTDLSTGNPTAWAWDFGDGHTSTEQNPTHTYGAGKFSVTLTVTNESGSDTKTSSDYITVHQSRKFGPGSHILVKAPGTLGLGCNVVCEGYIEIIGSLITTPSDILSSYYTPQTGTYILGNGKSPCLTSVTGDIIIDGTVVGEGYPANMGPGCNSTLLDNLGSPSTGFGANHAGLGTVTDVSGVERIIIETFTLTNKQYDTRSLRLSGMPIEPSNVALNVIHGPAQVYGLDYTVVGNLVTWEGKMEDSVSPGEELRFTYIGNTSHIYPGPRDTYGSYEAPTSIGSGSGYMAGGGGVQLKAPTGTVFLNGLIDVNGESNDSTVIDSGGGSGGSIWVEGWNIDGTGTLTARGGTTDYSNAGNGAGGYISLWHGSSNSFFGTKNVTGPGCSGDGILFDKKIAPFMEDRFTGHILNSKWWEVVAAPVDQTNALIMDTTSGDFRNPAVRSKFHLSGRDIRVDLDFIPDGTEAGFYNSYFLLYTDPLNWVGMARKYGSIFGLYSINGAISQSGVPYDYSSMTFRIEKQDTTYSFLFYDATSLPQLVMTEVIPEFSNEYFKVQFGTSKPDFTGNIVTTEYFSLSNTNIANKYLMLSNKIADTSSVAMNVIHGTSQIGDGTDFLVQGNKVIWDSAYTSNSPSLDEMLVKGDVLRIIYESDASNNALYNSFDNFKVFDGIIHGAETSEPVLYVDPVWGHDSNDGRQLTPLKNLFVATAWAKNNSIVALYDGTHNPTRIDGKDLTLLNAYGAKALITSINSQDTTGSNWENSPLTLESCQALVEGVTLKDSTYGIYAKNTSFVEVRDCTVVDTSTGIAFVQYTADPVISRNTIQATGVGVRFESQVYRPYVYGNVMYDSSVAIHATDTSGLMVSSNTLDANDIGVIYDANSCGIVASNNITSGTIGIKIVDSSVYSYTNNFYLTDTTHQGVPVDSSADMSANPLYINAGARDYHIDALSPDRSSGLDSYDRFFTDRGGMSRTQYPGYDIGAYEYNAQVVEDGYVRSSGDDFRGVGTLDRPFRTLDRGMVLADSTIRIVSEITQVTVDGTGQTAVGGQFDSYYLLLKDKAVELDATNVGMDASVTATVHSHYSNVNISKTIYVSVNGSDSTVVTGDGTYGWGNGLISNPYRTIQRALQDSSVGDYLIVSAGTYPILNARDGRIVVPYADRTGLPTGNMIVEDQFPAWDFYNHNLYNLNWEFTYDGDSTVTQGDGYLAFTSDGENAARADSKFLFTPNFEAYAEMRAAVEPLYFSVTDTTSYVSMSYYGGDYTATVYTNGAASSCWGSIRAPEAEQFIFDYLPITSLNVNNKYVSLNYVPNDSQDIAVNVVGSTAMELNVDYYIEDSKVKWDGKDLDGLISAGDTIRVIYKGASLSPAIYVKLSVTDSTAAVAFYDYQGRAWYTVKKKMLTGVDGTWSTSLFMDSTAYESDFFLQKTFDITDDPWQGSFNDEGFGNRIQNTY